MSFSIPSLFSPKRPTTAKPAAKPSPQPNSPPRIDPAKLAKWHDLLSHAEIDLAKLSADLQSRRKEDPARPIIQSVKDACETILQRIKREARNERDLEGLNQLLAFFESIPRSLKALQVGGLGCPSTEQFCQALSTIAETPVGDLSQLKINLNLHRMAYGIPSLPQTRKYC